MAKIVNTSVNMKKNTPCILCIAAAALFLTSATVTHNSESVLTETSAVSAEPGASEASATIIKDYKCANFRGVQISSVFDVDVRRSSKYSLQIEISKEYEQYLDVKVVNGILRIGFTDTYKAKKLFSHMDKCIAVATISMPTLESVELSGASKLNVSDSFDLKGKDFRLRVSGASEVYSLNVSGGDATISVSGASRAALSGCFNDIEIQLSGASKLDLDTDAEDIDVDASGSSSAQIAGTYESIDIQCSGACGINLSGSTDELEIGCSGASGVNALKMAAGSVGVDLSGASYAKVFVLDELEVDCSGASSCSYKAAGRIDLDVHEVSRSASLKKL